jgi:hypothetical protein
MVEVRGYVRSGNNIFWQTPSGKLMRVGSSRLVGAYPRIIANINKITPKVKEMNMYSIDFKHKTRDIGDTVVIPAYSTNQAESYFLKLNGSNFKIMSTKRVVK